MTGKEKIHAAFSKEGTCAIPAVICHERIFTRDHWRQLVSYPKWYMESPDLESQIIWRNEVIDRIRQDWIRLLPFYSREERGNISIEVTSEGTFRVDKRTGKSERLVEVEENSSTPSSDSESVNPDHLAESPEEIDELIPVPSISVFDEIISEGRNDLAATILNKHGNELYPFYHAVSPLCSCYSLWGFEGMMTMIAAEPELVKYACRRYLDLAVRDVQTAALLGARGIWIEEYFTDIISPDTFKELNVPFMKQLTEETRSLGLNSIYYFCGNPAGRMEQIISVGTDAVAFEESKKGISLDIEDIVDAVRGRCTVLGNLDAIGILQNGTEEQLRAEIKRQIAAGHRNGNRFIMSIGSPVTPGTPVERVSLYCDLVREYA